MDSKDSAAVTERSYEEFQPKITWKLEECPVYELTVPDFKKEHLNVKLDQSEGILKINGERPLGGNRWQQFSKTIPISKDSKINDFNAKLSNGVLRIALPKTVTELDAPPQKLQQLTSTTTKTNGLKEKTTSDVGSDDSANKANKLGELMKADSTTTARSASKERDDIGDDDKGKEGNETKDEGVDHGASGDEDGLVSDDDDGDDHDHHEQQYSSGVARLRRPRWVMTVIVVVIAVMVIGAYTRFMLRTLSGEEDHHGEL
ncbi:hypothetical protein Syun_006434 [Stephania yunnanensis]|uniref:SHSP domain-containing protein n=1 Tax=Stephania yunnanensis TaxID=152371 RepID=A0AAP0KWK6_9MAGN